MTTENTWNFTDFSIPLSTIIGYPEEPKPNNRAEAHAHSLTSRTSSKSQAASRASSTVAWPERSDGSRIQRRAKEAAAQRNEARLQNAPWAHNGCVNTNTADPARLSRKAPHQAHAPVTRRNQRGAAETAFVAAAIRSGTKPDIMPPGVSTQPMERREQRPPAKNTGIPPTQAWLPQNSRPHSMPAAGRHTSRQAASSKDTHTPPRSTSNQLPSGNPSRAPPSTSSVQSSGESSSEEEDDDALGVLRDPRVEQQRKAAAADRAAAHEKVAKVASVVGGNTSSLRRIVGLRRLQAAVGPLGFSRSRQPVAVPKQKSGAGGATAAGKPTASAAGVLAEASRSRFNPWGGGGGGRPAAWQVKPDSDAGEDVDVEGEAAAALVRSAEAWDYTSRPEVDKR